MTTWKKAISVATSAALLASLLSTVAAPAVFGANTSAGGGVIYPDYGAGDAFSLSFKEDVVAQFGNGSFTVSVHDANGNLDAVDFINTAPTVTRDFGLGAATAGFSAGNLVVTVSGMQADKIDGFTIGGLKVKAYGPDADPAFDPAVKGALVFLVAVDGVGLSQSLVTVTGTTTTSIDGGFSTAFAYALDNPGVGAVIDFQPTNTVCANTDGTLKAGQVTVAAAGVSPAEPFNAIAPTGGGIITKGSTFTAAKPAGTAVSQSICASVFPSPVTVGDAVLTWNEDDSTPAFQAGTNSNDVGDVGAQLGWWDKLLKNGDVVTFTLDTAGVTFSPDTDLTNDVYSSHWDVAAEVCQPDYVAGDTVNGFLKVPALGADRKSITVALSRDSLALDCIDFGPRVDVAASVANGTAIEISVTVSRAGVVVLDSPVTVGYVGFLTVGSTSAPTIYIGQNDQSTGMITIKESAAGVIDDDADLSVCLQSGETWAIGRYFWAVVTAGDLKFNVGGLPVTQAKMTLDGNCLDVKPYHWSSTASTIEIRDGTSTAPAASAPTAGPKVNVPSYMTPGQTYVRVYNGYQVADNIVIAVRAYSGTPSATTSGQLTVVRGLTNQATGSITFTEGAPNQFGSHYDLELCLVYPSASYTGAYIWSTPTGANQPVVTTNSTVSGLIASFDPYWSGDQCLDIDVVDTGLSGLGTITISNLKLDVKTDAPTGPVFVRIYTDAMRDGYAYKEGPSMGAALQATVSPAIVVAKRTLNIGAVSAVGNNPTSGYSTKTPKSIAVGTYVTWKFTGGAALAGQRVSIMVAKKINGAWTGPSYFISRWADSNGIVTFVWKSTSAQWINVRAQWPGNAMYNVSTSKALAANWQ